MTGESYGLYGVTGGGSNGGSYGGLYGGVVPGGGGVVGGRTGRTGVVKLEK